MGFDILCQRFAFTVVCLLTLPLAAPSFADTSPPFPLPLGYVGPVPSSMPAPPPSSPPLGYTGPAPSSGASVISSSEAAAPATISISSAAPTPPLIHSASGAIPLGSSGITPHTAPLSVNAPPIGYVGPVLSAPLVSPTSPRSDVTPRTVNEIPLTPASGGRTLAFSQEGSTPTPSLGSTTVSSGVTPLPSLSVLPPPPPLGYVGPAPEPIRSSAGVPPLGYTGPIPPGGFAPSQIATAISSSKSGSTPPPANTHAGETLITAKYMNSDTPSNILRASGNVEIVRSDYILHADRATYDQASGIMTVDGHVAVLNPTGEVEFASHEQITGDMKQAYSENVGVLFPDNSRMAATDAIRYDERYTVANKGAYTSCNVCLTDPNQPPLWQLHADTITHDNELHKIYYHDATVDFDGVPLLYTPYLSTPDPTVKRQQGFLTPSPGYSANIGPYVKIPYYLDIAPDKDATITPTFSKDDKVQLASEYRERFDHGFMQLDGSITYADLIDPAGINKGDKMRGDLFGTGVYDINSTWRVGADIQYVSDQSYLQRYDISSLDQTTSRAYLEGFNGRDYAVVNSYYFQDQRPGVDVSEPLVLPSVTVSALGDPGQTWGGRWSFDGSTLITTRDNTDQTALQQGPDTRRLSLNGGWQRQLTSDTGLITTISGLARTDSYWADNVPDSNGSGGIYNEALFTREFAQANAVMRYPMGRTGDGYEQLVEPIVALTGAPTLHTIAKQPNEDSIDIEYDETNLFSPNRFTGNDLIEGGSRVTYGLRNAVTLNSGAHVDIFGGESYDFTPDNEFPTLSGLNNHASDYVGRIDFAPADWLNANYGFRLAQSDFSPQRQDAQISFGVPIFRPNARYLEVYETDLTTNTIDQVKELTLGFSSNFAKYYTLSGFHVQSFDPQPGPRNSGLVLTYVDECFSVGVTLAHDDTDRADISSGTSVAFHFYLKNIGGAHTDSVTGATFPAQFRQTDLSPIPGY